MKKEAKELVRLAERFGYVRGEATDKRIAYTHPDTGHVVHINPSTDSKGAGAVRMALHKANGSPTKLNKRNADNIKARQAKKRAEVAANLASSRARLDELLKQRDLALIEIQTAETKQRLLRLEFEIDVADATWREYDRLMREIPSEAGAA